MAEQKYTTYYITQEDGTKKPFRRKIRDENAWLRTFQLTCMRKSVSIEVKFTVNYYDLMYLRYRLETEHDNSCSSGMGQLIEALNNAKKEIDNTTEREYNAGRYFQWCEKFKGDHAQDD